jgi:hypothetical protein
MIERGQRHGDVAGSMTVALKVSVGDLGPLGWHAFQQCALENVDILERDEELSLLWTFGAAECHEDHQLGHKYLLRSPHGADGLRASYSKIEVL